MCARVKVSWTDGDVRRRNSMNNLIGKERNVFTALRASTIYGLDHNRKDASGGKVFLYLQFKWSIKKSIRTCKFSAEENCQLEAREENCVKAIS